MTIMSVPVWIVSILAAFLPAIVLSTVVPTSCGPVNGTVENGIQIFKGIPYAKPPLGDLRWRPPQPLQKQDSSCWNGTLQAKTFGSMCFQRGEINPALLEGNEDCLYLNVWTPTSNINARLPVMVWIHGGYLECGSGNQETYSPTERVVKNTGFVFVSMNYRLQLFGFMALKCLAADSETGTSGNYGFMDQILALQWVQANIANFGGDPNQVTIFGQSSGGTSIFALLASPLCEGLFQKAWLISTSPVLNKTATDAFNDNLGFLERTKCQNASCLRSMSAKDLTLAVPWDVYPYWSMTDLTELPERGVFDGALAIVDGYVLPESPFDAWKHGRMINVPLLIGSTAQEVDLLPASSVQLNWTQYENLVRRYLTPFGIEIVTKALTYYPPGVGTPELQYTTLASNIRMTCGNDYMSSLAAKSFSSPVYRYIATYRCSKPVYPFGFPFPANYSFHGVDIFGFFESLDTIYISQPSDADRAWQANIQREVIAFVKTGRPDNPFWKPYPATTAEVSVQTTVSQGYKTEECAFWLANGFFSYSWIN